MGDSDPFWSFLFVFFRNLGIEFQGIFVCSIRSHFERLPFL